MKTLVIYDSMFGNTKKIAQAIGESFGNGAQVFHISKTKSDDLTSADMLIIGSPTHGGQPSQKMKEFLNTIAPNSLNGIKTAAFDTGISVDGQKHFMRFIIRFFGYAAKRLAKILKSKGANIVSAETFFVLGKEGPLKDGELDRATEWAKDISNN
ncbi:flavodoxin family protein [Patescibacteria group bacterium]